MAGLEEILDAPSEGDLFESGLLISDCGSASDSASNSRPSEAREERAGQAYQPQAQLGTHVGKLGKPTPDMGKDKMSSSTMAWQLRKTKFCMFYLQGSCHYGERCTFAHNISEMQSAPDLQKTKICQAASGGACGDRACPFAHSEQELRAPLMFHKRSLCIWFDQGKCRNGESCRFAHGFEDLQPRQAPAPIQGKYRHKGGGPGGRPPPGLEEELPRPAGADTSAEKAAAPCGAVTLDLDKCIEGDSESAALQVSIAQMERHVASLTAQFTRLEKKVFKEQNLAAPTPFNKPNGTTALSSGATPFTPAWLQAQQS